jgi:divalent metal cation (Fe/Co/Zn/Cd) transporter
MVLGIAIVLETISLVACLNEIRKVRRGRPFRDWLTYTRNAELVVVLGEDIAAELGLVIAFVFVSVAWATGDTRWDAAGSIAIGVVLIVVALFISRRIKGLLVGRSAEPALERGLKELIAADDSIQTLLNTITVQFGPQIMLAAKIHMRPGLSIDEAVDRINRLERRIKERYPEIGWCFVEPDVTD